MYAERNNMFWWDMRGVDQIFHVLAMRLHASRNQKPAIGIRIFINCYDEEIAPDP